MIPFRLRLLSVAWCAVLGVASQAAEPQSSLATTATVPETVDSALVPHYTRLTPTLAAAGPPAAEAIPRLREMGFKTVVNLRVESEPGVAGEAEAMRAQGLAYISIPVTPDTFSLAEVAAVLRVIDDPQRGPVLLHCSSSNRVGGVWAVIQARARGLSVEDAVAEGRKAGLHSDAMVQAVERVLAASPAPPVK